MAALTGIIDGTDVVISLAGTTVSAITTNNLEITMATRNTTNKDSGAADTHLPTRYNWSVTIEGLIAYDGTYSYEELLTPALAGTSLAVIFGSLVSGNPQWSGNATITGLSQSAPDAENNTFSATLQGNGVLTPGTTA